MSLYWINNKNIVNPKGDRNTKVSWECWDKNIEFFNASEMGKTPEQIGYVDLIYTTIGMKKYIASFNMSKHPEQQEIDTYVPTIKKGKQFVEEQYMAWRMIGTLNDDRPNT
ncbi:MAG: hypothetical protein DRQ01_00845 [Ignavibacteriae bacterium]|nr:MAG: hypothetical protein DRQ01_00845 [Ignavibacteriota bacterium]